MLGCNLLRYGDFGLQEKGQRALAERLPKSIGWGMGLEFRESQLQLTARNAAAARPGMVFNVTLGAQHRLLWSAVRACFCSLQRACACDFA